MIVAVCVCANSATTVIKMLKHIASCRGFIKRPLSMAIERAQFALANDKCRARSEKIAQHVRACLCVCVGGRNHKLQRRVARCERDRGK